LFSLMVWTIRRYISATGTGSGLIIDILGSLEGTP
jgi:hypothetical protein